MNGVKLLPLFQKKNTIGYAYSFRGLDLGGIGTCWFEKSMNDVVQYKVHASML
jgi:hypothetical protein